MQDSIDLRNGLSRKFGREPDEHSPLEVECLLSSDSDVGMAKTIGTATLGLADVLGRLRSRVAASTDRQEIFGRLVDSPALTWLWGKALAEWNDPSA